MSNKPSPAPAQRGLVTRAFSYLVTHAATVLAAIAVWQTNATLNSTRDAHQREQRAWVGPWKIEPGGPVVPGGEFIPTAYLTNKGATPALDVRPDVGYSWDRKHPGWEADKPGDPRGFLWPDGETRASAMKMLKVSPETFTKLVSGELEFRFYGRMRYRDVFGAEHTTNYCYRLLVVGDQGFVACGDGNTAD